MCAHALRGTWVIMGTSRGELEARKLAATQQGVHSASITMSGGNVGGRPARLWRPVVPRWTEPGLQPSRSAQVLRPVDVVEGHAFDMLSARRSVHEGAVTHVDGDVRGLLPRELKEEQITGLEFRERDRAGDALQLDSRMREFRKPRPGVAVDNQATAVEARWRRAAVAVGRADHREGPTGGGSSSREILRCGGECSRLLRQVTGRPSATEKKRNGECGKQWNPNHFFMISTAPDSVKRAAEGALPSGRRSAGAYELRGALRRFEPPCGESGLGRRGQGQVL